MNVQILALISLTIFKGVMMLKLGPVLKFLDGENDTWRIGLLAVTDATDTVPTLIVQGGGAIAPSESKSLIYTKTMLHLWQFSLPLSTKAQAADYSFNGSSYKINLPAKGQKPAIAYASCNGFSDPKLMSQVKEQNALWKRMKVLSDGVNTIGTTRYGPWHLLLMGGDQIYSDAMWNRKYCRTLADWAALDWDVRVKRSFTVTMQNEVNKFFESTYISCWSQPDMATAFASIPSIMMWDDHDILDGWGSYPFEMHYCDVYQGIFSIAREYFKLFQLQSALALPTVTLPQQSAFNQAYRLGDLGLVVLDMRSEREPHNPLQENGHIFPDQVMSEQSWNAVYKWLDAQKDLTHLLVMSSIPVVHPSLDLLEKMLGFIPGQQELEDDLRDHWRSQPHQQERLRLIKRLLGYSAQKNMRITILSGDVHVAAVGVLESSRNDVSPNARVINQLTSSGIVHPAPPAMARYFLEQACKVVETVDRDITATMYEFPATSRRLIGARNFLTLEPDDKDRLWANWWVEGESTPTTKVIHPVQPKQNAIEPMSKPK